MVTQLASSRSGGATPDHRYVCWQCDTLLGVSELGAGHSAFFPLCDRLITTHRPDASNRDGYANAIRQLRASLEAVAIDIMDHTAAVSVCAESSDVRPRR
jgi:uncharacterized paraquat-inducible protein A